jgi:hypothetical protein
MMNPFRFFPAAWTGEWSVIVLKKIIKLLNRFILPPSIMELDLHCKAFLRDAINNFPGRKTLEIHPHQACDSQQQPG